jgi:hypothetical protein
VRARALACRAPPQPYPYLHIRNKQFPWGTDLGFFERPAHKHP